MPPCYPVSVLGQPHTAGGPELQCRGHCTSIRKRERPSALFLFVRAVPASLGPSHLHVDFKTSLSISAKAAGLLMGTAFNSQTAWKNSDIFTIPSSRNTVV